MFKNFLKLISSILTMSIMITGYLIPVKAEDKIIYKHPQSPSEVYNMNLDWKYMKPDVTFPLASALQSAVVDGKNFYDVDYDDSSWETVSIPHQVNAHDSFTINSNKSGDQGQFRGIVLYRKHFIVPESAAGKKIFIEFEGMYNAAYVWVNGQKVGYYEAAIAPFGFDLTEYVVPGEEAVIAIVNDSTSVKGSTNYFRETIPGEEWGSSYTLDGKTIGNGTSFHWMTHDFMTTQAGLVYNVNLYIKNDIYQTFNLYNNLKTTGTYIYADNFNIRDKKATIHVKSEIRNETANDENLTLRVDVVKNEENEEGISEAVLKYSFDASGIVKAAADAGVTFETVVKEEAYKTDVVHEYLTDVETVDVSYIEASFDAENLDFWSIEAPHLYDVYTILENSKGEVIDVQKITTGFRKVEYSLESGLEINDEGVWLSGYAQRSANEWAAIGSATDWLTDYDMSLVRESGANFIRWMHNAPRIPTVRSSDKYGIVVVAPGGDKESDSEGRKWSQRVEAMRSSLITFRNSPSVIFWEAGNAEITAQHQQEMTDLKVKIDPYGGRFMGCRTIRYEDQITAAEYVGTMLNRNASTAFTSMKSLNKYVPIMETEYHREESPRRVWDDFSPPDYDYDNNYRPGGSSVQGYDCYDYTSEDFVVNDALNYEEFYNDRVNGISGKNYYAATAALCWSDSGQAARNTYSENARMSGRVDLVRLPKQSYFAYQTMHADEAKVHIVGHWNYEEVDDKTREEGGNYYYPIKEESNGIMIKTGEWGRRDPSEKTVYVVGASPYISRVDLLVDGEVVGTQSKPINTFIYQFPEIDVTKGKKVEALAYNAREEVVASHEIKRAGEAATLRLTPYTGPEGLLADGSDLMYFDVEVVDAEGNVCPLSYDKINFELSGDATFMGGYNSGMMNEESVIGKDYVYAECGINRVFVKAGRSAGAITLKATMEGGTVAPVTATISSVEYPEEIIGGLTNHTQQTLEFGKIIDPVVQTMSRMKPLAKTISIFKNMWTTSPLIYQAEKIVEKKDIYSITVNEMQVRLVNEAYKPDATTGIICEARAVLDALEALGADCNYTYEQDGDDYILTMQSNLNNLLIDDGVRHTYILRTGETGIGYDDDPTGMLTNAEIYAENGEIMVEINAFIPYIVGVSASVNEETKINAITFRQ